MVEEEVVVSLKESDSQGDDGGQVDKLKGFPLVGLLGISLEGVTFDVKEHVFGGYEDIGGAIHPHRQSIEAKIDGILRVIHADSSDVAPLQEERIPVDLSDVLDED
jgi:hypothetical protein